MRYSARCARCVRFQVGCLNQMANYCKIVGKVIGNVKGKANAVDFSNTDSIPLFMLCCNDILHASIQKVPT